MTAAGLVEILKPTNPVLPCTMALVKKSPLSFPLAEMTGQFKTKAEATITLMMRILLKMKLTKHPVWVINGKMAEELQESLQDARNVCWGVYFCFIPGPRIDHALAYSALEPPVLKIGDLVTTCDELLDAARFKEEEELRPWDTFKMLASFLFVLNMDVCKLTGEQMGFPGVIRRRRVTSAKFNDVWQKVLDKMHGGLVPYQTLVQVMCGGQLEQVCHGCSEEVRVSDAILLCKRVRRV